MIQPADQPPDNHGDEHGQLDEVHDTQLRTHSCRVMMAPRLARRSR